jgi:nucleotide-binding universal stress UspA family protein
MTSHPKIVVGIDGTPRGEDALAFATVLARMVGTGLLLAYVYGPDEKLADAHALLDPRREAISEVVAEVTAYADSSPARGLARVAAARSADIIVVGSSHRAGVGLMLPGGTGERLVHESDRAVAIVPTFWRPTHTGSLDRIGCGYDGSRQSDAALETATALTRLGGRELDVVHAFWSAGLAGPVGIAVLADLEARAHAQIANAGTALPHDVPTHASALIGDPARALVAASHEFDVLVLGSRGKGPIRAAVTGSVSTHVVRESACPVLVVTHDVPPVLEHASEQVDVLPEVPSAEEQVADA